MFLIIKMETLAMAGDDDEADADEHVSPKVIAEKRKGLEVKAASVQPEAGTSAKPEKEVKTSEPPKGVDQVEVANPAEEKSQIKVSPPKRCEEGSVSRECIVVPRVGSML
jgi:hypothetical protein